MIAHVAEIGEQRGRVVLQLPSSGKCSDVVVDAAMAMARAFNAEIESLFVEDVSILDVPNYPFAFEISHSGRITTGLALDAIEQDLKSVEAVLQRRIRARARQAEVSLHCRTMRDDPVHALAVACAENGPWNIVALGEPAMAARIDHVFRVFAEVQGTTGIVLAGSGAKRVTGPVVALIEDYERIGGMIRAARRIAAVTGGEVRLFVVGTDDESPEWLEGQIRLATAEEANSAITLVRAERSSVAAIAEQLRREKAGFVIARATGIITALTAGSRPLAAAIEGPVLLVR